MALPEEGIAVEDVKIFVVSEVDPIRFGGQLEKSLQNMSDLTIRDIIYRHSMTTERERYSCLVICTKS